MGMEMREHDLFVSEAHALAKRLGSSKAVELDIKSLEAEMAEIAVRSNVAYPRVKTEVYGMLVGQPDVEKAVLDLFTDKILPRKSS